MGEGVGGEGNLQDRAGAARYGRRAVGGAEWRRRLSIGDPGEAMTLRDRLAARSDAHSLDLLIDVATRHYLHGASQHEIARDLNLDPSTISRYLKRARDEGIVQIEIVAPRRANVDMGLALARELGLARVLVAELRDTADDPLTAVAAVAAQFASDQLRRGTRVGIGWGESLAAVVDELDAGVVE